MTERHQKLCEHAVALGDLLVEKQTQYGDSVGSTGAILRQLYPTGIRPDQYDNLQLVVRVLDKLKRIASQGPDGTDRGGESPWRDIGGYGILGLAQAEQRRLALPIGVQVEYDSPRDSLCGVCGFSRDAHSDSTTGPICPRTCRGCKHATDESPSPLLVNVAYCRKTNRPHVTARVELNAPRPTWCPGFEALP